MPTASASDVRGVVDTDLTTSEIDSFLADAQFDNERANDVSAMSTDHIRQLEKHLAALKIRLTKDRSIDSGTGASTRIDFDGSQVDFLRSKVDKLDPSGTLSGGLRRDTDRHITSTSDS